MMPLRKSYEITGYADTENGVAYCLNCVDVKGEDLLEGAMGTPEDKFDPIFLGDEWDAPGPACNNCFKLIEITPIHYEEN